MADENLNAFESFYDYLISNGFYFNKELIENYLLSLKVKPFVILTGNSGTGKTKLSQLFAKYYSEYNSFVNWPKVYSDGSGEYFTVKVSKTDSGWKDERDGKKIDPGWTPKYDSMLDLFPCINDNLGDFKIDVGKYSTKAKITYNSRLFYDRECVEFKNHFKKICYDSDDGDGDYVDLKIPSIYLKSIINGNFCNDDTIHIKMNLPADLENFSGGRRVLSKDILEYIPFNDVDCKIYLDDFKANAYFDFGFRIKIQINNNIKNYFKNLKKDNETKYDLTIYSFKNIFQKLYELIPVGANWTDNTNIVGYHNVITGNFNHTPTSIFIRCAKHNLESPYFLILDEMNLSHVERYFADFLSAIESGEEIHLYGNNKTLKLPNNLFIIGTVNVDETTYMFSPKVLDRANTIEFDTVSALEYMTSELNLCDFEGDVNYLQSPLVDSNISNMGVNDLKRELSKITCSGGNLFDILSIELSTFQEALKGSSFDFGFRVINEILRFMVVSWRYENSPDEWDNWERYFDAQIKQKILPKLHGSEKAIGNVLTSLFNLCLEDRNNNENPKNFTINKDNCRYYTSALKLQNMSKVLSDQRYVSFIN